MSFLSGVDWTFLELSLFLGKPRCFLARLPRFCVLISEIFDFLMETLDFCEVGTGFFELVPS